MKKILPLICLFFLCSVPSVALAQECSPTAEILWSSPEKNAVDVPSNSALILSIPLGQTIVINGPNGALEPRSTEGFQRFIFPINTLDTGTFNGAVEIGSGGSTSKKYPFKFDVVGGTPIVPTVIPEVTNLINGNSGVTSEECQLLTESLFCATEPHAGQLTLTMGASAHSWAVREADTPDWVIMPGNCSPSVKTRTVPGPGSCLDVVALNQAGESSEVVQACVGDSFGSESRYMPEEQSDEPSDSGCNKGESSPISVIFLVLLCVGWGRVNTRLNSIG